MPCLLTLQINLLCSAILNAPLTAGWTMPTVSPSSTNPVSKFIGYDLHCSLERYGNSHKSLLRGWKTQARSPKASLKAANFCRHRPWPSPALEREVKVKLKSVGGHVSGSGTDGKRFGSVIYDVRLYLLLTSSHLGSLLSSLSEAASQHGWWGRVPRPSLSWLRPSDWTRRCESKMQDIQTIPDGCFSDLVLKNR